MFISDGWTNCKNESFLATTAHFIDSECKQKTYLLACEEFSNKRNSKNIAGMMIQHLNRLHVQLVLDVPTRWYSTFHVLEVFYKDPIVSSLAILSYYSQLTENDWTIMNEAY